SLEHPSETIVFHNEDGNPARANIKQALGFRKDGDGDGKSQFLRCQGRSSYARVMIELRADVELKDNIIVAMSIIKGDGYYTCNIRVEYEWKSPRCACCKVFGHVHEECPKNISAGATTNLKKPSQTPKGIPVGQKVVFKPKQVFQPVLKKSTANTCGKKMNNSESTKEVSKSNPFEVLTSVYNDVDLGKLRFVDDDGNPLVPTGIVQSNREVEVVFDEPTNLRISTTGKDGSDKGYGTNSLLER
ncbi:transposon ty3-G gag-pol polyprotein, partial [Tanacetum coccineum]